MDKLLLCSIACVAGSLFAALASADAGLVSRRDSVSRCFHVTYDVPVGAPDEVTILCSVSPTGKGTWRPANVTPLVSDTAMRLASADMWRQWTQEGRVTERRAAGLRRTVIFNAYPEAQQKGLVDVDFRVKVLKADGAELADRSIRLQADNSDVVYIEDWSKALQADAIENGATSEGRKWAWKTGLDSSSQASLGNALYGTAGSPPLPQLTYPLDLRGSYAIFVCTAPDQGSIGLRLTGDERTDRLGSSRPREEVLWRWSRMDSQHLVLKQPHTYAGYAAAGIDYVKLVPLTPKMVRELESDYAGKRDKTVVAYFEPYSWSFNENVQETLQHRQPLTAYAEADVSVVDMQIGRFGMKVVYESRRTDQLVYSTIGDPINGVVPTTSNVGQMQQYTNTLDAELRYARELDLQASANFGASNCYVGTPLQGDISKQHPEWVRGSTLRYELPEVRAYVLGLFREALEMGAPAISTDFCRYPECIDSTGTCTGFLRELRALADEFGSKSKRVPIMVRFPANGVRLSERFDFAAWTREGLVDRLCPSTIQGRHNNFDIAPYVAAVRGTKCKLIPVVDGISWGPVMPGPYLYRVKRLYDAGADGINVYQADGRILGHPADRRCVRMLGSSEAVRQFCERDARERPRRSKGIYISKPEESAKFGKYERLRVWLEGVEPGAVELYLDGKLVSRYDQPPYTLGTEGYESDNVIPSGEHVLRVRAKDGEGWLEESFEIRGA